MSTENIKKILGGDSLNIDEAHGLFMEIMSGELNEAQIAGALVGMKMRGETPDEVAGAALAMNEHKLKFDNSGLKAIDTCGTGGDGKSTLNVSTAVSLVLASMDVPVVKHGNVAMSGKVGSADILQLLGIPIDFEEGEAEKYFKKHGFIFLFAQKFHPAMRFAGPVRRSLGVPTIFNLLGPLSNPAEPTYHAIGIGIRSKLELVAEAVMKMKKSGYVIYASNDGYDEVSSNDITECYKIDNGEMEKFEIDPADYFEKFPMPVVKTNDEALNMFMDAVSGTDENLAKLIALNTALSLYLAEKVGSIAEGYEISLGHIQSGKVVGKIESMRA